MANIGFAAFFWRFVIIIGLAFGVSSFAVGGGATGCGSDSNNSSDDDDDDDDDDSSVDLAEEVSGSYVLTLTITDDSCDADITGEEPFTGDTTIEHDSADLTVTMVFEDDEETYEASVTGTITADEDDITLTGTDDDTFGTCNHTSAKTMVLIKDPFDCSSFIKVLTKTSGDCDEFLGAGNTECTLTYDCDLEESE